MDSLSLSDFLFLRVENTILQKDYIEKIEISFEHSETFGNEYIKLSYVLNLNEKYDLLSEMERIALGKTFGESRQYIFSLGTHSENRYEKRYENLLRVLDFKTIYSSLTSYIVAQFEKYLLPETTFIIQGVDHWPQFNYAEKYLRQVLEDNSGHKRSFKSDYKIDIAQYAALHELSNSSRKIFRSEKDRFKATDQELAALHLMELSSIRHFLRSHQVPIHITGIKTIDKIHIHVPLLVMALRKEIYQLKEPSFFSSNEREIYRLNLLIDYLYTTYLADEKKEIEKKQKEDFIRNFILQEGDILELIDERLVITDSVSLNENDDTEISYYLLKTDLSKSVRRRTVNINEVLFYIKSKDFKEYQKHISIKHLSLLKKWMVKKKSKLVVGSFALDFIQR